jgi:hypothetical protein
MQNAEPGFSKGYKYPDGFEAIDGRPAPSGQAFIGFRVTDAKDLVLGQLITGVPSGASGKIIGIELNADDSKADHIGVTKITGTFALDDVIDTVANALRVLRPNALSIDASAIFNTQDPTNINEDINDPNGAVITSVTNDWTVSSVVDWPLNDLGSDVTTINAWTLKIRSRLVKSAPPGTLRSVGPENNDTVTYRFTMDVTGEAKTIDFTEIDVNLGFSTRVVSEIASSATPADINAEPIRIEQPIYTENGFLADGIAIEVDTMELEVDYDGDVVIVSTPVLLSSPTLAIESEWLLATQDDYRADIAVVPGSGMVTGAWQRRNDTFAIRDNVGATAGVLHLASASGWTTTGITMGIYIFFENGLAAGATVISGDLVTGASSGAQGTLRRIILNGGSVAWDGSGEGYFVFSSVVNGPFTAGEVLESPVATPIADAFGADVTLEFSTGGRYEFINHNFLGFSGEFNVYGANGVDDFAFEIDEFNFVSPIILPLNPAASAIPPDGEPYLVEVFNNHLFLAFPGSRVISSSAGNPLNMSGFLSAAEFGAGDEVTGLQSVVGNVLVITTTRQTFGLFGKNILDWELKLIGEQTGGRLYSVQKIDTVYALDDLGITSVARTDAFGDFAGATLSEIIQPVINSLRDTFTAATLNRNSNQYRLYFEEGVGVIMYVPAGQNKPPEFGLLRYPFTVSQIYNTEDGSGNERTYFVTNDPTNQGFVFEDQKGTNFNGAEIVSYVRTAFTNLGTPGIKKQIHRADISVNATKNVEIKVIADFDYGNVGSKSSNTELSIFAGPGIWDSSDWDDFIWDGQIASVGRADIKGYGENIGFLLLVRSKTIKAFTMQEITVYASNRRVKR